MFHRKGWAASTYRILIIFTLLAGLIGFTPRPASAATRVAYIYSSINNSTAVATRDLFITMLSGKGLTVDAYDEATVALATTSLSGDQAIIIADDAGAVGIIDPAAFAKIQASLEPVLAIGAGGSLFFSQAGLNAVTSGGMITGAANNTVHAADPYAPIWTAPDPVFLVDQTKVLYSAAVSVYAYQATDTIQFVTRIGRLPGDPNHYSLIAQSVSGRCYTYWGFRGAPNILYDVGKSLFYNLLLGSPCAEGTYSVNAALASTAPAIDGNLNFGEWTIGANLLRMDHGFFAAMNDNIRLYLLLDVLEASTNNPSPNFNDFMVSFDVDKNAAISPGVDLNYGTAAGTQNMRYQFYNGPANWTLLFPSTKSSLGPGFDCYTPDGTKVLQISPPKFNCASHQLFEIAIDLHEIHALPGQTIHLGIQSHSPNPNFTDDLPNVFEVDFSNLIALHLAGASVPTPDPATHIAFDTPPYEITQVVQNVNNSIPLVGDKTTAGRVSIHEIGSSNPQPAIAYLYGQRGGADLPGSPLAQLVLAPPAVDRGKLSQTANFLLPPSWIVPGEVFFHAEGSDYNGNNIASAQQLLLFQRKKIPTYWMIQENMGSANTPDLLPQSTIDAFTSYTRAVFPVPDINFVQKPWTVLGALNGMNLNNNVATVENLYATSALIYWSAINQNKVPPFTLPDLIFGAADVGGGLSDPTWFNNSPGHAAAGGFASSGEGVVAHEFNHDLDRSSNGTWGRHVNACGAAGPDPNWPYGTDPAIHEYGFDTRLPWQNTPGQTTVIPPTWPDLMSYCGSGSLPTKWVAPYRYQSWFGSSLFPATLSGVQPNAVPTNSIYISGSLAAGGAGKLDPALLSPGMPIIASAVGAYTITLIGPGGALLSHSFDVIFQDNEGNAIPTVYFSFVLPDPGGVTEIQLSHSSILATITKSTGKLSAAFTNPSGNITLSGTSTISWTVSGTTTPPSGIRQTLEYSTDSGSTWMPVAAAIPGTVTSYALDTNLLPKSTSGKLRLLVTDGLNNATADSPGLITVANHPPVVDITAPLNGNFVAGNAQVLLQGTAYDVEETSLPNNNFLWTLDSSTVLGVGRNLQVVLPAGKHTLTLTALDSDGATGSASIIVFVQLHRTFMPEIR